MASKWNLEPARLLLGYWPRNYDFDYVDVAAFNLRFLLLNEPNAIRQVLQRPGYKRGLFHNNALRPLLGSSILCNDQSDRVLFRHRGAEALAQDLSTLKEISRRRSEALTLSLATGGELSFEAVRRLSAEIIVEYLFSCDSDDLIDPVYAAVTAAIVSGRQYTVDRSNFYQRAGPSADGIFHAVLNAEPCEAHLKARNLVADLR